MLQQAMQLRFSKGVLFVLRVEVADVYSLHYVLLAVLGRLHEVCFAHRPLTQYFYFLVFFCFGAFHIAMAQVVAIVHLYLNNITTLPTLENQKNANPKANPKNAAFLSQNVHA